VTVQVSEEVEEEVEEARWVGRKEDWRCIFLLRCKGFRTRYGTREIVVRVVEISPELKDLSLVSDNLVMKTFRDTLGKLNCQLRLNKELRLLTSI